MKNLNLEAAVQQAMSYIDRGWHVLPVMPAQKRPATIQGFKDATLDPLTVRRWFSSGPKYNVGIRTGKASNLLVVDVDNPESWHSCAKANGGVPDTRTVATPRGGLHLYFRQPSQTIACSQNLLAPGVDVKGEGGYVLAPVSSVDGRLYRLLSNRDPVSPPRWIVDKLTPPSSYQPFPTPSTASPRSGMVYVPLLDLERAIGLSLPRMAHTNHELLFQLARRVKTVVGEDKERAALAFDSWYRRTEALGFLRAGQSYAQYRQEFFHAWGNAWPMAADKLHYLAQQVRNSPSPAACRQFKKAKQKEMLAFFLKLGTCYLSGRFAARLFGVPHRTAARWLDNFVKLGYLTVTQEATLSRARYYSAILPPELKN